MAVDCATSAGEVAPVFSRAPDDDGPPEAFGSLVTLVEAWLELYEDGRYYWNGHEWTFHWERLPLAWRQSGLF